MKKKQNIITKASKIAKEQPKVYLEALSIATSNMKKDADKIDKIKSIQQSLKSGQKLVKSQASMLLILMSTNKIHQDIQDKFNQKQIEQAMLYLFLVMYNNSSFLSKFLMKNYIKNGLNKILK